MVALLGIAAAGTGPCDLEKVATVGELKSALSQRAVEIVRIATAEADDPRLRQWVPPTTEFTLGGGDVGMPMGSGVTGARAFSRKMRADRFASTHGVAFPPRCRMAAEDTKSESNPSKAPTTTSIRSRSSSRADD